MTRNGKIILASVGGFFALIFLLKEEIAEKIVQGILAEAVSETVKMLEALDVH